ncbi:hypothetical protein NDU88_004630 [Pleurodeles waltl]|uniref:Uncharacterized protein n=1 Tax=Pleurodeles waltl TaxID=8319 RepID=A0AAV7L591_PLEWA|nr:hypothetical protein NDU88_004630 [Pleurodeles waltl]
MGPRVRDTPFRSRLYNSTAAVPEADERPGPAHPFFFADRCWRGRAGPTSAAVYIKRRPGIGDTSSGASPLPPGGRRNAGVSPTPFSCRAGDWRPHHRSPKDGCPHLLALNPAQEAPGNGRSPTEGRGTRTTETEPVPAIRHQDGHCSPITPRCQELQTVIEVLQEPYGEGDQMKRRDEYLFSHTPLRHYNVENHCL